LVGAKAQQFALSDREWFAFVLPPSGAAWQGPRTFVVPRDHGLPPLGSSTKAG
jgi:hypothetical protein